MGSEIPVVRTWFWTPIEKILNRLALAFDQKGDLIRLKGYPMRVYCLRNPDHVRAVFNHPSTGQTKCPVTLLRVKWVMGNGGYVRAGGDERTLDRRRQVQTFLQGDHLLRYANQVPALLEKRWPCWDE